LKVDTDVLFVASFLHDMSAFMPCKDTKLDAAVRSAERGHMYYSDPRTQPEALVFTTPILSISSATSAPRG
jgi:hypothetical protein